MWNNKMASFRSRHYPGSKNRFLLQQEVAMRYYAVLSLVVMIGVVLMMQNGRSAVVFGIVAETLVIFLGNFLAGVQLRRKIAEIFFVNDGFSVISIHDILDQKPKRSFPVKFANPVKMGEKIQFHFEDQVMEIHRDDWGEEYDLIWSYFNSAMLYE